MAGASAKVEKITYRSKFPSLSVGRSQFHEGVLITNDDAVQDAVEATEFFKKGKIWVQASPLEAARHKARQAKEKSEAAAAEAKAADAELSKLEKAAKE